MIRFLHISFFIVVAWLPSFAGHTGPENTKPGLSYLRAKHYAETHSMKYVLYFKADWCTPCKWMEETTFADKTVEAAMDNVFIMVPLDIDEFEGYALKEYFDVYSLPTFLVFNEKHELVNRREGSVSATGFMDMVANDQILSSKTNTTHPPAVTLNAKPERQHTTNSIEVNQQKNLAENSVSVPDAVFSAVTKYGVQLGAFSSYENAKAVQDRARQYTSEPVEISTLTNANNIIIYKVFAGKLDSSDQAKQLQRTLSNYGVDGFVKTVVVSVKS